MEELRKKPLGASIDVTQLMNQPVGSSQTHDIGGAINEEVKGVVAGKVKLTRVSQGILVQARLTAELKLQCSRCLDIFSCPVSFDVEEEFLPTTESAAAVSLAEESEDFTIDSDNVLDLEEMIRQYVLLNVPMKPLCRPDCPGIKEENSNAAGT
ncbi:MAG: YceD family protein [Dehalococcoidia bacterium]